MASNSNYTGKSKRNNEDEGSDTESDHEVASNQESGKRMKKDDSGINVEESSDSENSSPKDTCPAKGDSQNSPDSGHPESCSQVPRLIETFASGSSVVNEVVVASGSSQSTDNTKPLKLQLHTDDRINNISDSDSDHYHSYRSSTKKEDSTDSDDICELEKADEYYDPTPHCHFPKHKWVAPMAIASRQYGYSAKYTQDRFRYECSGSLHVVERLELMYKMKKHDGCVNALHFNSKGTKLASGSDDLDIVIWDWTVGEPLMSYNSGHRSNVFQAKFMPLGQDNLIVSCGRDGQVRLGELSESGSCKKTRKLAQHKGSAHKLALQTDSAHTFYSCGEDAAVFQIDIRAEKPLTKLICKQGGKKVALYSIFANPMVSSQFVIGGRNQFIKVYDARFIKEENGLLRDLCPRHLVNCQSKNVTSVVYNYNGSEILASYNDDDIYSFENADDVLDDLPNNKEKKEYLHRYRGHKNSQTVKGVNYFGPKSEYIISGSDCGFIFFWDKQTEHIVKYMYGDEGGVVNCLEPNPIVPMLATSGLDDDIKIWVPSCETPPDLSGLRKHLISNMRERDDDRKNCPEAFIDQTIWFLMQHLARSRRGTSSPEREERGASGVDLSSTDDSDESEGSEDLELRREIQCNQS